MVNLNGINFSQLSFARTTGASTNSDLTITVGGDSTNTLVLANWGSYMGTTSTTNRIVNFVANDATFGLAIGTTSAESLFGSSLNDYILGNDGGDTISGGAGSDSIYGQGGDDQIVYKSTAFLMDGGDGTDTVNAASATAAVDIDLRNVDSTKTQYTSIEYVNGSSYDDILRGSSLAETLAGGAGADAIWGAAGADVLAGGAGTDTYWFGGADGNDTVDASTLNSADYVNFSSINGVQIGGADISSTVISGNNLTITLTSGDSLTLSNWTLTDGSKVNKFTFGSNGTYSLAVSSDNVATWTKL